MHVPLILVPMLAFTLATPVDITKIRQEILSSDVTARNSLLENLFIDLLEDLRVIMVTGSGDIPVLDPLGVDHVHLDDEILPINGAHVTMNGMEVSKLSTFVVDTLNVNSVSIFLQTYRVEFDFYVPSLAIDAANYDLALSASGINIFGNGDAKINIIEPRAKGSLVVGPRFSIGSGLYLVIRESEINFTLKEFDSQINGLLNDDAASDFLNMFLKYFVPELVQLYEADITAFLSATVLEIGNEILADLNLGGILG